MKNPSPHSGQVALIMVLIMTVLSGIAVSLASRSTIETRIQEMNVENTEAFLTAQAGLEESIAKNSAVQGSMGTGKDFTVTVDEIGTSSLTSEMIRPGETLEINLDGAISVTGLQIYWRGSVAGGAPAIFVTDIGDTVAVDYAFDAEGTGGFTKVVSGGTLNGVNYDYKTPTQINISPGISKKLKITVLNSAAFIGVEPVGGNLPPQFTNLKSVAEVSAGDQNVVKYGIQYLESKTDQLPAVFDYVLFSGGTIVQ